MVTTPKGHTNRFFGSGSTSSSPVVAFNTCLANLEVCNSKRLCVLNGFFVQDQLERDSGINFLVNLDEDTIQAEHIGRVICSDVQALI